MRAKFLRTCLAKNLSCRRGDFRKMRERGTWQKGRRPESSRLDRCRRTQQGSVFCEVGSRCTIQEGRKESLRRVARQRRAPEDIDQPHRNDSTAPNLFLTRPPCRRLCDAISALRCRHAVDGRRCHCRFGLWQVRPEPSVIAIRQHSKASAARTHGPPSGR